MTARGGRLVRRSGHAALWITAVLGVLSLLLGLATLVAGVQPLIVRSASMEPVLGTGSLAIARTVDASAAQVGDVVSAVDAEGRRVTHRVTAVDQIDGQVALTLQGDANAIPDAEPYLVDEVESVLFDVPWLGYVAVWVSGPAGMFLAGLLVAALLATVVMRPRTRRAHVVGVLAMLTGFGVLAGSANAPVSTDAYFSDTADFEAGTIMAHSVQGFDWAPKPCVESGVLGRNITVNYQVKDPRYTMVWDRYRAAAGGTPTRIKEVAPSGSAGSLVSTEFTGADLSTGLTLAGSYRLVGTSKLKGSATTEWLSSTKREVTFTITGLGALSVVDCGSVNIGPTVSFTAPTNGTTYANRTAAENALSAACEGRLSPCGTATDQDGIKRVEYILQRVRTLGTYCWDPNFGTSGYNLNRCQWRDASTSPGLPTSSATPVKWWVPVNSNEPTTVFQNGNYTLYLRVTDNAGNTATTESTITFRRN